MSLEVRVEGAATLHKVAAQMRTEGRKSLAREMTTALSRAAEPVKQAIRDSAGETMPRRGGYNAAFLDSLKFRMNRRSPGDSATVKLTTYAEGEDERRDIGSLERGSLRHPVYGRSRPGARKGERHANPWSVTKIRPGFHRRGTDGAMDAAQAEMENVINEYAHRLAGG